MKQIAFIVCNFLLSGFCQAQIMDDMTIDEKAVSMWNVNNTEMYEGIYFFGISEGEAELFLSVEDDMICVQVRDYNWTDIGDGISDWRPEYVNYKNVRIVGNKFYSTETNGEFVIYAKGDKKIYGLKLLDPPTGGDEYEIGTQGNKNKLEYMEGKYAFTKFDIVSQAQLDELNLQELRIMRNEIYARYGHSFAQGGEMDLYFSKQGWYRNLVVNAETLLTEIEKENIRRIKRAEASQGIQK